MSKTWAMPCLPSTSQSSTFLPRDASASASDAAMVVFPVPPLPVTMCRSASEKSRVGWSAMVVILEPQSGTQCLELPDRVGGRQGAERDRLVGRHALEDPFHRHLDPLAGQRPRHGADRLDDVGDVTR